MGDLPPTLVKIPWSFRFSQEAGNYVEHIGMVQNLVGIKFQASGVRSYALYYTKYPHAPKSQ